MCFRFYLGYGPANSVKQCISKLPLKKEANCDITLENCTQRKHSLRFLSHVFFQAFDSWWLHSQLIAIKLTSRVLDSFILAILQDLTMQIIILLYQVLSLKLNANLRALRLV